MTLPAFATLDDLDARHPGGISDVDAPRALASLDDASALIRLQAGKTWVDDDNALEDVPDIVVSVTCRAALRAFTNPTGVAQQSAGPFSQSYANSSSDVYLTKTEGSLVRRAAGRTDLASVRIEAPALAAASRWLDSDYDETSEGDEGS